VKSTLNCSCATAQHEDVWQGRGVSSLFKMELCGTEGCRASGVMLCYAAVMYTVRNTILW